MNKIVLALDQSSRVSGYAVFQEEKLIQYGHFTLNADLSIAERLVQLKEKVLELIQNYGVTKVLIEDIQLQNTVGNNVATYKALAEVYGVLEETLSEYGIDYEAIYSSVWKSGLGIKGRNRSEQKRNAQAFVTSTYGVQATQDESDAICIGTHYINSKKSAF